MAIRVHHTVFFREIVFEMFTSPGKEDLFVPLVRGVNCNKLGRRKSRVWATPTTHTHVLCAKMMRTQNTIYKTRSLAQTKRRRRKELTIGKAFKIIT